LLKPLATACRSKLMEISDLLSPTDVMIDVRASDKSRLLRQLPGQAASALGSDLNHVSEQIAKREELGSTGVGNGVALPHARGRVLKNSRTLANNMKTAGPHAVAGGRRRSFSPPRCP